MRLPQKDLGDWAMEIIAECSVSRQKRVAEAAYWRNYYFNGADQSEQGAIYNKTFGHIDRLASFLFSPADVRFLIEFDSTEGRDYLERAQVASRFLSREIHRTDVDIYFGMANEIGLIEGCALMKLNWGHHGFDPDIVHPGSFGVLREDITSLDKQEAFVHTTFLTPGQYNRLLHDNPKKDDLLKKIKRMGKQKKNESYDYSMMHEIIVGAIHPIAELTAGHSQGSVAMGGTPSVNLDPEVMEKLVPLHELWVMDDEREDYTTIQIIDPEIIVAGQYKHENLCGVKGEHPFRKVCANEIDGYFWGRSEIATVKTLQDILNRRMDEYDRLAAMQADPSRSYVGYNGITDELNSALNGPGGYITESQNPAAKVENLAPKMPPDIFQGINEIIHFFDDVAGFENIMQGKGESGVRAGVHADTLMRSAGNRLRDRALLVERQCAGVGDFCFRLLQNKDASIFTTKEPNIKNWLIGKPIGAEEFMLSQFPDDYRVVIDSHSASPAFSADARTLAEALAKLGAIDAVGLLELTQPPQADILIARAKDKEAAQARMMQEHPELLSKGGSKSHKK